MGRSNRKRPNSPTTTTTPNPFSVSAYPSSSAASPNSNLSTYSKINLFILIAKNPSKIHILVPNSSNIHLGIVPPSNTICSPPKFKDTKIKGSPSPRTRRKRVIFGGGYRGREGSSSSIRLGLADSGECGR